MRLGTLFLFVLLARVVGAQAPGATVSGVVRDSVARTPLAGAIVQLVAADGVGQFGGAAVSDSMGRFAIGDVPDGRYTLGFLHPMLDSLGLEPPLREVHVAGHRPVRADLGVPSPARLRAAICGSPSTPGGGVVLGVVRDARDLAPAAGVTVTVEWLELSFKKEGIDRRMPRLVWTTKENGWFAMCNVPSPGTMTLFASRGADSTDLIEVQLGADGFLRRELYLGPARTVVTGDATRLADTLAPLPRKMRVGDGSLSGTVVAAAGGKPLAGAQVGVVDGPRTRANERGEWTLRDAPTGTRMLEIRAIGYYPDRRPVDVVPGAVPVRVALLTLKAVLDTVRVTASRLDGRRTGFEDRRRSGLGRYLTAEDILRRQRIVASDLFKMMPGIRMDGAVDSQILMRGTFEGWCSPAIYLNGLYLPGIDASDLDTAVRPNELTGIEVYVGAMTPVQFQRGLSGCGAIVIWMK